MAVVTSLLCRFIPKHNEHSALEGAEERLIVNNDIKWMMCSDVHFPRHDPRKVELFLKVMKWFKPHAVDLLGDIDDADPTRTNRGLVEQGGRQATRNVCVS